MYNWYQEWGCYCDEPDYVVLRPLELIYRKNVEEFGIWGFKKKKPLNAENIAQGVILMRLWNTRLREMQRVVYEILKKNKDFWGNKLDMILGTSCLRI